VEEGEGEDSDGCYASDVQESIYQGVSIFVMGSSSSFDFRDDARLSGRIENVLPSVWSAHLNSS